MAGWVRADSNGLPQTTIDKTTAEHEPSSNMIKNMTFSTDYTDGTSRSDFSNNEKYQCDIFSCISSIKKHFSLIIYTRIIICSSNKEYFITSCSCR